MQFLINKFYKMYKKYIITLLFGLVFNHTYSQIDTQAPQLISINISPDTINTKNGSAIFSVKVIAKDDVSGVKNAGVWYKSPSGLVNQSVTLNFSGKLQDTATATISLPQYSESGIWKISSIYFNDNANNYINLSSPFSSFGKASVIVDNNAEIKNGAVFLIKDAYNIKSRFADVISTVSIIGNSNSYHDIRWQYQKGDRIGVNPEEQNLVIVDGPATLSNVNKGGNLINLTPGTKYSFRLVSKNKNGNIQDFSETKQFVTLGNTSPIIYDTIFSIKDTVRVNGIIGKIRSVDVDADILFFKIKSGNINETFKIDSLGNIFVKNKIQYNKSNKFDLLISVNDGIDSTTAKVTINIIPFPIFNYSGVFGVCTGDSLKVNTNKYSGYSIIWYKNGQVLNSQNIDTIYIKEAANYQIKIINGADIIASVIKTFVTNTIPSSPATLPKNLCQNEKGISLSATATFGNRLIWYGTNRTGGSSSTTAPFISTASTGNVDYYVSQKNTATGCESPRTKMSVTINPVPVSPSVRDTAFCQNSTNIFLSAVASLGNSLLWYDDNATGGSSNANASIPIAISSGFYTYYVSQKNSITGCESTRSKIGVTINPLPLQLIVRDTSYCQGALNVNALTAKSTVGFSLKWYENDASGGIASTISPIPSVNMAGIKEYFVSQVSEKGCESERVKIKVVVKPTPITPVITNSTPLTFCYGQNVVLTSSGTNNQWYLNGNLINNATATTFTANASGAYKVKATNGDCSSPLSTTSTVVVNPIPPTPLIIQESNGGLTSSSTDGNQWYFNDEKINYATQKTINPTKSGNYTVKVTTPCASEVSKPYSVVITATEETIFGQVQLSPNPFLNQFKLSFPLEFGKTAQVKIVDMSGNVQFKMASVIDGEQIDLGNLNSGNYILHLNSNDNSNSKAIKISKIH
jgi:hypothetical protein